MKKQNSFGELFKKYRLKSEISTLSEFGRLLSEKGFNYEDSIFSHWQNGARIPQYRTVLLKLLEIFIEKGALTSKDQANDFLSSAVQGYLTERESEKFQFNISPQVHIPSQIADFTGRQKIISKIKKHIIYGKTLLLYGPPGVGKTSLAIELGHLLKNKFPDGVLWYRSDTSDLMDVLLSIAYSLGKDIGHIEDKEIRASTIRQLLSDKKVLLIFDNAEASTDLRLLLPNSKNCSVIITSRNASLSIPVVYESIPIETFTQVETLSLFKTILGEKYLHSNKSAILKLGNLIGNLPLALHIFVKELKKGSLTIHEIIQRVEQDYLLLEEFSYEDKNLFAAIELSFNLLDTDSKQVFISLAVFNGKDFSTEAAAFINDISEVQTLKILNDLTSVSLIERSAKTRFRIHPVIKNFIRKKLDNPKLFLKAAKYYESYLSQFDKSRLKSYPNIKQESDNVLYIFKKCYELQYWNEVIVLWDPLENLLFATNQLTKMRYIYQIAKNQSKGMNVYQKTLIIYFCLLFSYWFVLQIVGYKTTNWNHYYSLFLAQIPLIGGLVGFSVSKSWGLFKSSIGKSVLFLSAGLVSWGSGNIIWAYYNFFLNDPVPYPSLADIGYLTSYPLWTVGMIYLPHAIGGESHFKKKYGKLFLFIPFFILTFSYYLVTLITQNSLVFAPIESYTKLFLDISYPAGDVIILTTALIMGISFKFFGGKYKFSIYSIIIGFCFLYLADFLFSYTTTAGIFYDGYWGDITFAVSFFLVTFGILGFYFKQEKK